MDAFQITLGGPCQHRHSWCLSSGSCIHPTRPSPRDRRARKPPECIFSWGLMMIKRGLWGGSQTELVQKSRNKNNQLISTSKTTLDCFLPLLRFLQPLLAFRRQKNELFWNEWLFSFETFSFYTFVEFLQVCRWPLFHVWSVSWSNYFYVRSRI